MRELMKAAQCESPGINLVRQSLTERLEQQKASLETALDQVNETLDLIKKHPETQAILDNLSKIGINY